MTLKVCLILVFIRHLRVTVFDSFITILSEQAECRNPIALKKGDAKPALTAESDDQTTPTAISFFRPHLHFERGWFHTPTFCEREEIRSGRITIWYCSWNQGFDPLPLLREVTISLRVRLDGSKVSSSCVACLVPCCPVVAARSHLTALLRFSERMGVQFYPFSIHPKCTLIHSG